MHLFVVFSVLNVKFDVDLLFFNIILLYACGFFFRGEGKLWIWNRGVNLYGLSVSRTDFCDLHGLTGVRCNPYGYLLFLRIQNLQSFHALYSNCCEFAVTPSMLHEAKHATAVYIREHENK